MASSSEQKSLMTSTEELRPYVEGLKLIRTLLGSIISRFEFATNPFESWPTPNHCFDRTPSQMFLETARFSDGTELIAQLYTPLGQVMLSGSGFMDKLFAISKEFLETMDWDIREVTNEMTICDLVENSEFNPRKPRKETWKGAGTPVKVYLISRIGKIQYPQIKELKCYANASVKGAYETNEQLLKELNWNQ